MVSFHAEIPYAVAERRGAEQERLLDEITAGCTAIADVDLDHAVKLVDQRLTRITDA
jgi:hypothetical protein